MSYYFIGSATIAIIYGIYRIFYKKTPTTKIPKYIKIKDFNEKWEKAFNEIDEEVTGSEYSTPEVNTENKDIVNYLYYKFDTLTESDNDEKYDCYDLIEQFCNTISHTNISNLKIILHISSGGGVAYKFEKIYNYIEGMREQGFYIIAFVDDLCASGGYMIASACNEIICTESATIGSVGVYASCFNANELARKIGLNELVFKTSHHKGGISKFGQYSEEEKQAMEQSINYTFNNFKKMIHKYRPDMDVDTIATAETWYGYDALEKKMVDKNMTMFRLMYEFKKQGDIYSVEMKQQKKNKGFLSSLLQLNNNIHNMMQMVRDNKVKIFV